MKYDRQALIAATEKAIKTDAAAWARRQAEARRQATVALERWTEQHAASWAAAAESIGTAIRKGQPIVDSLLPSAGPHGRIAVYSGTLPSQYDGVEYTPHSLYTSLLTVLGALADDEVTTAALAELGIESKDIRHLAEYLPIASVRR